MSIFIKLRRKGALYASLSAIAVLAGCGGAEENFAGDGLLSPFPAPGPVDIAVLLAGFDFSNFPNVVADTAALLASAPYLAQYTQNWGLELSSGEELTGLNSYPLKSSGAAFAHAAGLRGNGSIIAVSDDEFLPGYAEFAGTNVLVENNRELPVDPGALVGHGTIVSAVALGQSADFIGTAPDATLLFGTYETDQKLADVGNQALALGAVAWNNSWGYPDLGLNQNDFDAAFTGSIGSQNYLEALKDYSSYGVVVFAAANEDNRTSSTLMEGLPYLLPELEAGWIAAVNGVPTFDGDEISSVKLVSSACLQSARWCLVADGAWTVPDPTLQLQPGEPLVTGSSFAAPQISGALALLEQAFPDLTPHELRVRLLASAEDDFFTPNAFVELATGFNKGYSFEFGHGFLDIEAALRPIGGTMMTLANGNTVSTNAPVLASGTGLGDALEVSLASTDLRVKDALAGGFVMPGTALTAAARPASQVASILSRSLSSNLGVERTAEVSALDNPFSSLGGTTASFRAPDGSTSAALLMSSGGGKTAGVQVTRVMSDGPLKLELGMKLARDDGERMSLDGDSGALMASVSLGLTQDLGGSAFLALAGEVGMTDLGGSTALGDAGTARFDSLSLTAGRSNLFQTGDRLSVGVGMPIAIASGGTVVDLPVYRKAAAAGFEPVELNFAPESRQIDLGISYQTALADGLEMKLSVAHSDNFGNRAGMTDTGGALAVVFRF
ncbi:S8 family peptidase [Tabrizicola sp. BL-A-41-H6]|uniref:S8 family peptidase n=1 Tax=Tabrizicola sp. BL-A-41-H6 TaxID=3421107 RepID=UPI003D6695BD